MSSVIGIDISKSKFDAAILLANNKVKTKKFDNKHSGFEALVEWAKKQRFQDFHTCMEATGNYGEALATFLYNSGLTVSVVNPAQIKGFAQSSMSRNKTDRADAILIARFCLAVQPKAWAPDPAHIRGLQDLVRRLEALQDMFRQETNRLHVASDKIKPFIQTVIDKLSEQIDEIKKEIKDHISQHPDLNDKKKLLETIPGIGEATIAQVLAFIGDPGLFKNAKQLAAFLGLNPRQKQSGTSVNGRSRLSKVGDAKLRKAFYMPAIVAKNHNPALKVFAENLKGLGKNKMVIIGAIMRKLVHIIYGVLRSGMPFDARLACKYV
jgi:transposase